MTDIMKLIERLYASARGPSMFWEAAAAIEALQAENERLKRDVACHDDMSNEIAYLRKERDAYQQAADKMAAEHKVERDALAAKLDELTNQEPEPLIKFRHGCKWCGKAKCAAGCYGITKGTS